METQIQELYNPLFLFVRNRIRHREDAEDLTQEVFLKLSKSNGDHIQNVKNWVYTIAKNTITDYYRKKKIQTESLEDATFLVEPKEDDLVRDLSCCIFSYIDQLPEEYQAIMRMSEMEEMPQKEIAEQLGMNYTTVRSKVQRGRKRMRDLFSECCTVLQGGRGSILDYEQNRGCGSGGEKNEKGGGSC